MNDQEFPMLIKIINIYCT